MPLGGAGEIGMNLNLYGYGPEDGRKWIMIDLGVMFGDDDTPGVDVIMPDPGFIEEHTRNLLGIVLTHAHEDHIGAVGHLWPRLQVPRLRDAVHRRPRARQAAKKRASSTKCRSTSCRSAAN